MRRAQSIARVGNWELDLRTQKMWASEEAYKIYGLERIGDSLSLKFAQQVPLPEFRSTLNSALHDLITSNKEYNLEFKIKRPNDGQERFIHSQAELAFGDDKTPIMVNGVIQDITDRKKVEEALIVSEKNYRNLINGMGESAWVIDFEGNFLEVNDAAVEMLGYCREELLSLGIKGIDKYLSPEQVKNLISRVASGKNQIFETVHTSKDGTEIPVEISSSLITYQEKPANLAIARNITKRKKAEESLKESEEKFRDLAEESPNIIFIIKQSKIVYANKKSEEITGYKREELYSPNFDFHSLSPPKYAELVRSTYYRHLKGQVVAPYTYEIISKEGKKFDAVVTSKMIEFQGEKAILGIVTDVSELKKAEDALNRTMNELVSVNEKLSVVGSLTRHDVRNKLSTITGYTYLLRKKHNDQVDIVEGLGKIEQSVADSIKIFEFAKMYEQLGVEELTYVDLGSAVDEAAALFSGLAIKIINECHGKNVLADSFLRQMFYNFIDNTRKYGVKVTTIKVYCQQQLGRLSLIYEDDGIGISAENKSRLFTEGFSTGGSTGFGLFLIKKMMDVYGWHIVENGELGKGAKFIITIPDRSF